MSQFRDLIVKSFHVYQLRKYKELDKMKSTIAKVLRNELVPKINFIKIINFDEYSLSHRKLFDSFLFQKEIYD